jgi:hypothetical protein
MRPLLSLSIVWVTGVTGALQAEPATMNTTTVAISNGPFAGSYTVDNHGCLYIKDRDIFGVTFKKFAHHPTAKTLEEAAIQVDRASAQGAKTGDVTVKFLDVASDKPQDFSMSNVSLITYICASLLYATTRKSSDVCMREMPGWADC